MDEKRIIQGFKDVAGELEWISKEEPKFLEAMRRCIKADRDDMTFDHYEEFQRVASRLDRLIDHRLRTLDFLLDLKIEANLKTSWTEDQMCIWEDIQEKLTNMRLDYYNAARRFDGEPTPEELASLPTPEQVAAEKKLAYETGGASLLPKQCLPPSP